jgi:hypothetical protein
MFKKHRRLTFCVIGVIVVFIIAATMLHPRPYYTVRGFIKGESFYDGWPTSYYHDLFVENEPKNQAPSAFRSTIERLKEALGVPRFHQPIKWLPLLKGDPESFAVLRSLLDDDSLNARIAACNGLSSIADQARHRGTMVPELRTSIPRLIELLRSNEESLNAAKALGAIGPDARAAEPDLERLLTVKRGYFRDFIAEELCLIDANNVVALEIVIEALNSPDRWACRNAVNGLHGYICNHGVTALLRPRRQALMARLHDLKPAADDPEQIDSILSALESSAADTDHKTP